MVTTEDVSQGDVFHWMKIKTRRLHHFTAVTAELHSLSPHGFSCVRGAPAAKNTNKTEFNNPTTAKTRLKKYDWGNCAWIMC